MKILLAEPGYKTKFPPLGLLRISSYHKKKGDYVEFVKGIKKIGFKPDKIYITTLFTYQYKETIRTVRYYRKKFPSSDVWVGGILASTRPDLFKNEGVRVHIGLLKKIEKYPPDYSLFPDLGYSLTFASRGCPNNCAFCVIPLIEGKIYSRKWIKDINPKFKKIIFLDNNWTAKNKNDWLEDIRLLKELKKKGVNNMDFNQSIDCYDEKTEVLTEDGWKFFKDVNYTDKIATLNQNTHYLEYQTPQYIINKEYKGEMICFKNNGIDLCVTPKHNIFFQTQYNSEASHKIYEKKHLNVKRSHWSKDREPYHLESAEKIIKKTNLNFKKNAIWKGQEEDFFEIPKLKKEKLPEKVKGLCRCGCGKPCEDFDKRGRKKEFIHGHNGILNKLNNINTKPVKPFKVDDFVEFMGWFLSEGCSTRTKYTIAITQTKSQIYRKEIYECCKRLGVHSALTKNGIVITNKQLYSYLKKFGKAKDKFVPSFIKKLSKRQIYIFLNAYCKGDGNGEIKNGKIMVISSSSKRMIGDLQELALKCGWSGNIKLKTKKGTAFYSKKNNKIYKTNSDVYYITIRKQHPNTRIYNNFYYKSYEKSDISQKCINLFKSQYYKDILRLKHIENKQIKEIAEILKVTKLSVTKNLYWINKRLKENGFNPKVIRERKKISYSKKDYDIIKKNYDGRVYCVTVPNEVIYVRRNGKTVWCGNCRITNEEHFKQMKGLPISPIRFSFDHLGQDKFCQKAIKLAKKYGFGKIHVDVLYNWEDTIEDFYYRLKEINLLGATAIPMRYVPLDRIDRKYIGKNWTKFESNGINRINPYPNGQISSKKKSEFEYFFGKNAKEFKKLLNFKNIRKLTKLKMSKFNRDKIWKG